MDEYDALLNEADAYLNPEKTEEQINMQDKEANPLESILLYKSDLAE